MFWENEVFRSLFKTVLRGKSDQRRNSGEKSEKAVLSSLLPLLFAADKLIRVERGPCKDKAGRRDMGGTYCTVSDVRPED